MKFLDVYQYWVYHNSGGGHADLRKAIWVSIKSQQVKIAIDCFQSCFQTCVTSCSN